MLDPRAQAQAQGGVLMIIGKRLAKYMGKKGVREKDQRTVTAEFNFPRGRVRIHAMYAPANGGSERERHWEMWKEKINDGDDTTERIIIGDMNAYPRACDARRKSGKEKTPSPKYCEFIEQTELVDTFVQLHKGIFKPTFEQKSNDEIIYEARIDAALVSSSLMDAVVSSKIGKITDIGETLDHKPVILELCAEKLGISEERCPILPTITTERIDVKGAADPEKLDTYKKKLTEYICDMPEVSDVLAAELSNAEAANTADKKLAEAVNAAGRIALGTYDVTYNAAGGQKENKKLTRLRRYLKRVNRTLGAIHRVGAKVLQSKTWTRLQKNPAEYRPAGIYRTGHQLEMTKMAAELRIIQHKLEKNISNKDKEVTSKRIERYLDQLDENEERNPQRFFQKANIDRRKGKRSLYEICLRDKEGKIETVLTDPEDVKEFIRKFWEKIFAKKNVDKSIYKAWFDTEEWRGAAERVRAKAHEVSAPITAAEIARVLKTFKKGTAPGEDGVPIECYQNGTPEVIEALAKIYNAALNGHAPTRSWMVKEFYLCFTRGVAQQTATITDLSHY